MFIRFITTGGTIDKIYFDATSQYEVGESNVEHILGDGLVNFDYDVVPMFQKDSLEFTDENRQALKEFIENDDARLYVITHGTDTMVETAAKLSSISGKTVILTGSLSPARFKTTDAIFNIGMAVAAVQSVEPAVYIAMNGQIFAEGEVFKNCAANCCEKIAGSGPDA